MKTGSKSGTYQAVDGVVYPIEMLLPLLKEEFISIMKKRHSKDIRIALEDNNRWVQVHNGCASNSPDKLIEYNLYKALLELLENK